MTDGIPEAGGRGVIAGLDVPLRVTVTGHDADGRVVVGLDDPGAWLALGADQVTVGGEPLPAGQYVLLDYVRPAAGNGRAAPPLHVPGS